MIAYIELFGKFCLIGTFLYTLLLLCREKKQVEVPSVEDEYYYQPVTYSFKEYVDIAWQQFQSGSVNKRQVIGEQLLKKLLEVEYSIFRLVFRCTEKNKINVNVMVFCDKSKVVRGQEGRSAITVEYIRATPRYNKFLNLLRQVINSDAIDSFSGEQIPEHIFRCREIIDSMRSIEKGQLDDGKIKYRMPESITRRTMSVATKRCKNFNYDGELHDDILAVVHKSFTAYASKDLPSGGVTRKISVEGPLQIFYLLRAAIDNANSDSLVTRVRASNKYYLIGPQVLDKRMSLILHIPYNDDHLYVDAYSISVLRALLPNGVEQSKAFRVLSYEHDKYWTETLRYLKEYMRLLNLKYRHLIPIAIPDITVVTCYRERCGKVHYTKIPSDTVPRELTCECGAVICRLCNRCHEGECDRPDEASLDAINRHSKPCPSCRVPIQKREGCDHMHCSQCNVHFCWACMETFGTHDIDRHMSNCTRSNLYMNYH